MREKSKTCIKCGEKYPATTEYFHSDKYRKDGIKSRCKSCVCSDARDYRHENPQKVCEAKRRHREKNLEKIQKSYHKWRNKNIEKERERFRKWKEQNRDKYNENARKYYSENPRVRISLSISGGIYKSIRAGKNGRSWESLVGYTLNDLMNHLESQFTKGMDWDNYGEWHIDHVKPISHFNFNSPGDSEFHECWSLWNLQPLWGVDNKSKCNKCKTPPLPLLTGGREHG